MAVSTRETAGGRISRRNGPQTPLQTHSHSKDASLWRLLALCWLLMAGTAQAGEGTDPNARGADDAFVAKLTADAAEAKAEALAWAHTYGFAVRSEDQERDCELMALWEGRPVYYMTGNVQAAVSTAADRIRDMAAWNLDGAGVVVGVWDSGGVRRTHQEFQTGSRVSSPDRAPNSRHSTHVGGTIGAEGKDPLAKGMAPAANINSFDWNYDAAQMAEWAAKTSQATNRINVSNHSYGVGAGWIYTLRYDKVGWHWTDTWNGRDSTEPWFGQYGPLAAQWDDVAFRSPYYLAFAAAGNERTDNPPIGETVYYITYPQQLHSVAYDPNTCPPGDGQAKNGYDTLAGSSVAKNIMTVGAVGDAVSQGARSLADANMAVFSSWGPTDDGRVKPDIVANGIHVYSTDSNSDTSYLTLDGTSMACPNATGSAALLVQLYRRLFANQNMRSSTLKGLIIHTADDLGRPGPDYQFGWGLMNARAAAELIQKHHDNTLDAHIVEGLLNAAKPQDVYCFYADGQQPIRVTLCWTDPPATAMSWHDYRVSRLTHQVDLRIIGPDGSTTYWPYILDAAAPRTVATTGDNKVDNVVQIYIGAPSESGVYRVNVSYEAEQYYSLISSVPLFRQNPPLAKDGTGATNPDTPTTITLSATDDSLPNPPGKLTYGIASLPSHGTLSLVGGAAITQPGPLAAYTNQVVYTPDAGYRSYDAFTFYADDAGVAPRGGISNTATIAILVTDITTVEYQVRAAGDDGSAYNSGSTPQLLTDRVLYIGSRTSAMRFQGVAVPRNVEIAGASLKLGSFYGRTTVTGRIYAEATGNPASLVGRKILELPTTQAFVTWERPGSTVTPEWTSSPDFRSVIQEIVDRPDWSPGNALMIIYKGLILTGAPTQDGVFYACEGPSGMAPKLTITYASRLDEPPVVIPPVVSHSRPVAQDIELYACSSAPTVILLSATDSDPCTVLSYGIAMPPEHGTLEHPKHAEVTFGTVLAGGSNRIVYRPDPGFAGEDSFTFYADDGATAPAGGKSNIATVMLKVRHMVTREYEVIAPEDDAYGANGEPVIFSETLGVGKSTSAMRFRNIDISQGNEIISAFLGICMSTTSIDKRIGGVIHAEAVGDANDFNEPGLRIANLAKTQASVPWTWEAGQTWPAQTYALSPDIHAVIQEIVDRGDWSISNDIAILYAGNAQNTQDVQFYACDRPYSTRAAKLQITYALKPDAKAIFPCDGYPPTVEDISVETPANKRITVTFSAVDDGLPCPPGRLTYAIVSLPSHGTLWLPGVGEIAEPGVLPNCGSRVIYQAQADFTGEDSFTFIADDGGTPPEGGRSNTATVQITVEPPETGTAITRMNASYSPQDDAVATAESQTNVVFGPFLKVGMATSAVRVPRMDIPRGSTILMARLKIVVPPCSLGSRIEGILRAEAADNPANFAGAERYLLTLPRTNASVDWTWEAGPQGGPGWITSPDISQVIQELVDRPGWLGTSTMVIILSSKNQPTNDLEFYSSEWSTSGGTRYPPTLEVTFIPYREN